MAMIPGKGKKKMAGLPSWAGPASGDEMDNQMGMGADMSASQPLSKPAPKKFGKLGAAKVSKAKMKKGAFFGRMK